MEWARLNHQVKIYSAHITENPFTIHETPPKSWLDLIISPPV